MRDEVLAYYATLTKWVGIGFVLFSFFRKTAMTRQTKVGKLVRFPLVEF